MSVSLSFPDSTYSDSNKPSATTIKNDLSLIETDLNTAIHRDGSVAFTANQSLGGFKITNLATPTATTDGATKAYVDTLLTGVNKFVVRETPADEDLDADGTESDWADWDLQSIVGTTATAVLLRTRVKDDTVTSYIGFRENGEGGGTEGLEISINRVSVADQIHSLDLVIKCDSSQVIEYKVNDGNGSAISEARATVIGWWEPIV